jgi:hypothetical protein
MSCEEDDARELLLLRKQTRFQASVLEAVVARLAAYEIPVDRVRQFLAHVEQDALTGFAIVAQDEPLRCLVGDLTERLVRIQSYVVHEESMP